MKRSCIIDLRRPSVAWEYPGTNLPDEIHAPTSELFSAIDLPNASLNCDAIVSSAGREVAGIAVRVDDEDWQDVQALFSFASASMVTLYRRQIRNTPPRYASLPEWNWVEVRWGNMNDLYVDEILSNCAVWYSIRDPVTLAPRIIALGIEHIGYFVSEIGGDVSLGNFGSNWKSWRAS